jgi:hypothetical protein
MAYSLSMMLVCGCVAGCDRDDRAALECSTPLERFSAAQPEP